MERNIAMVALFAALIAVLGLIPQITLAFGVPITAQTLGVMLAGTVLGARKGALACLLFIAVVALGLPLLSGGRGGLGVFAGPTVGFLVSWPVAAFVTGWITSAWRSVSVGVAATVASVVGGILVVYAFGILGMMVILNLSLLEAAPLVGFFAIGDAIKALIAGALTAALARARPSSVLSRSDAAPV